MTIDEKELSRIRDVCVIIEVEKTRKEELKMSTNEYERCEELKAAVKVLFEYLTYDEQKEIIALVEKKRQSKDRK